MSCPFTEHCPFFNDQLPNTPIVANLLKRQYCQSPDFANCARYRVMKTKGFQFVPPILFPDMTAEAQRIIGNPED